MCWGKPMLAFNTIQSQGCLSSDQTIPYHNTPNHTIPHLFGASVAHKLWNVIRSMMNRKTFNGLFQDKVFTYKIYMSSLNTSWVWVAWCHEQNIFWICCTTYWHWPASVFNYLRPIDSGLGPLVTHDKALAQDLGHCIVMYLIWNHPTPPCGHDHLCFLHLITCFTLCYKCN